MEFEALKREVKSLNLEELRKENINYFEAVILKPELAKLEKSLEKFLGVPVWPAQNTLSPDMRKAVDEFGGILPGQTLYLSIQEKDAVSVMLWPWQDGEHTTVKIISAQK